MPLALRLHEDSLYEVVSPIFCTRVSAALASTGLEFGNLELAVPCHAMVHHAWTIDCHDTSIRAARFQTAELSGGISRTCGPDRTPDISIVCTVLRLAVCC